MAATLTAKQMRQLLQNISADPQLKQSQDSILLAEDQYPDALETIFTITTPTTMQNTMHLLQWNRKTESASFDAELKAFTIVNQDYLRTTYQLVPTGDNPTCASPPYKTPSNLQTTQRTYSISSPLIRRRMRPAQPESLRATCRGYSCTTPYYSRHPGRHLMTSTHRSRLYSPPPNLYFLLVPLEMMGIQHMIRTTHLNN